MPAEIGFLAHHGISPSILETAVKKARLEGVTADAVLLAEGKISEDQFYRLLARHLHLSFVDRAARIKPVTDYADAVRVGQVFLSGRKGTAVLAAPRGLAIGELIAAVRQSPGLSKTIALTTPRHLIRLVLSASRERILADSSLGLWSSDKECCAKDGATTQQKGFGLAILALIAIPLTLAPQVTALSLGALLNCAFIAIIWLRLSVCMTGLNAPRIARLPLSEAELPIYSIVVALYREARIIPQLLTALAALDYPRAKIDLKIVIEEDDAETFAALMKARELCPGCEILVAPDGRPRTKPRALNFALPFLRGQLATVFDAEDIPHPKQIRMAAERFATAPEKLACLQASLVIGNVHSSWLTRLFAIEYAALFDVINVGFHTLGLPFPLGGSSNHFRTDVLREIGGWDAWNVTEDADIGLRLARFGYYAETLPSATIEEAPVRAKAFVYQRRRWCKGWFQTLIVFARNPPRLLAELGPARCAITFLVLASYAVAPLAGPLYLLAFIANIARGGWDSPVDTVQLGSVTLWTAVFLWGFPAILLPAIAGMSRRGLLGLWPWLFLLPAYCLLIFYSACMGLYELVQRPQHWHKTEHGLAPAGGTSPSLYLGEAEMRPGRTGKAMTKHCSSDKSF